MNAEKRNYSIPENLTKGDIIRTLRMNTRYPRRTVVLVEGPDDKLFWTKHVNSNEHTVICIKSYHGLSGLYDLLKKFPNNQDDPKYKEAHNRIIAIRDKDYTTLDDPKEYPERVFAYDYCNLEMMLLHRSEVQEGIRQDYEIADPKERAEIPMKFMRLIAPFSLLRKKQALEAKYRNIEFGDAGVMKDCGDAKLPDIVKLFQIHNLEEEFDSFKSQTDVLLDEELWEITNGHDLYKILGKVTLNQEGNSLGEKNFRRHVFDLYHFSYFMDTSLYTALKTYQDAHGLSIV